MNNIEYIILTYRSGEETQIETKRLIKSLGYLVELEKKLRAVNMRYGITRIDIMVNRSNVVVRPLAFHL